MTKLKRIYKDDPTWTVREHINKSTGKHKNTYYYRRKKALSIHLNSILANQLAGYVLIEKDLRNILIWLNELLPALDDLSSDGFQKSPDRKQFNIVKGLFVASLTFYGKCFNQCDGRKNKLNKKNIKDEKLKEIHEDIMSMRHNFAAHSGEEKIELVRISLVLDPKKERNTPPNIMKEMLQPDTFIKYQIEDFIELVEYLQKFVIEKMKALELRILSEEVLKKGKDYWYKKLK